MGEFHDLGLLALGHLAGGIPTGYLVVKKLKGVDIRTLGSGNPGTANVYRNAGAANDREHHETHGHEAPDRLVQQQRGIVP